MEPYIEKSKPYAVAVYQGQFPGAERVGHLTYSLSVGVYHFLHYGRGSVIATLQRDNRMVGAPVVTRATPTAPLGPGGVELVATFQFTGTNRWVRAIEGGMLERLRRPPITTWNAVLNR